MGQIPQGDCALSRFSNVKVTRCLTARSIRPGPPLVASRRRNAGARSRRICCREVLRTTSSRGADQRCCGSALMTPWWLPPVRMRAVKARSLRSTAAVSHLDFSLSSEMAPTSWSLLITFACTRKAMTALPNIAFEPCELRRFWRLRARRLDTGFRRTSALGRTRSFSGAGLEAARRCPLGGISARKSNFPGALPPG
jgi:hypothetical protein